MTFTFRRSAESGTFVPNVCRRLIGLLIVLPGLAVCCVRLCSYASFIVVGCRISALCCVLREVACVALDGSISTAPSSWRPFQMRSNHKGQK